MLNSNSDKTAFALWSHWIMVKILKILFWEPVQSYFETKEQKIPILLACFIKKSGAASTEIIYYFIQTKGLEFSIDRKSCP